MSITSCQVERFRVLLCQTIGFQFDDTKLGSLAELLRERADATGSTVDVYLATRVDAKERGALARKLTVTETFFFRGADQLRAFTDMAVRHSTGLRAGIPLQVLSAGCASGEEAYSLVMLAHERKGITVGTEISMRGVDINTAALERAAVGVYSTWALRETPAEMRERWFRPEGNDFRLERDIREAVQLEERNIAEEDTAFWKEEAFDVIFCRNVVMYFAPEVARAVVARFARSLRPGGLLFLGHAENLRGLSQDFHLHHTHGTFYYERKGALADDRLVEDLGHVQDFAPLLAAAAPRDDSWVETIRRATDRIHSLGGRATSMTESSEAREVVALPRWDLGPALELLGREQFSEARAVLGALPPESSRDPDVLLLRAVLLTHGGDLVTAAAVCEELFMLDEMSAGAHYVMALCREAAGELESAAGHDRLASHLDPGFAMPRLHLGRLALRAGEHADARVQLEHALVLLEREDASRVLLFGGGFRREALSSLCRAELVACGDAS